MDFTKMLEFRMFDFWNKDLYILLCYEWACDELATMYPNYTVFASDHFGISIIDKNIGNCKEIATFTTGRMAKIGLLAMKNERTKNVTSLASN